MGGQRHLDRVVCCTGAGDWLMLCAHFGMA